jgi:hypothetical protein
VRRPERPSARALPPAAADRADTESTAMIPMPPGSAADGNAVPGTAGQPWWKAADDDTDTDVGTGRVRPSAATPPTPPLLPPSAEPPPADPAAPAAAQAQAQPVVRVSPREPDLPGRAGQVEDGRSPLAGIGGTFLRRNLRELLAVLVLFVGGLLANLIVLLVGYVIALTSRVWPQSDKRFACIGVPLITAVTLGVMLWLRVTGRVGDRLGGDAITDLLRQYISTLPRVVGLVAAVYLAWRLTRAARRSEVRGSVQR